MRVEIPKIITHQNMQPLLDALLEEPFFQCGSQVKERPAWVDAPTTLEFPLGEMCRDALTTLALIGFEKPEPLPLTGKEGFNAQGLEGKVQVPKSLFSALMCLRDILPPYRGRILT